MLGLCYILIDILSHSLTDLKVYIEPILSTFKQTGLINALQCITWRQAQDAEGANVRNTLSRKHSE